MRKGSLFIPALLMHMPTLQDLQGTFVRLHYSVLHPGANALTDLKLLQKKRILIKGNGSSETAGTKTFGRKKLSPTETAWIIIFPTTLFISAEWTGMLLL